MDDAERLTKELTEKGVKIIYEDAQDVGTKVINFIHPKSTHGVLLEIVKRK